MTKELKSFHIQIHIPCREADLVFMTYMREMKQKKGTEEPTRRCSMQEKQQKQKQTLALAEKKQKSKKFTKRMRSNKIILDMMQLTKWSITNAHRVEEERRRECQLVEYRPAIQFKWIGTRKYCRC
jgi:hypothetical protein